MAYFDQLVSCFCDNVSTPVTVQSLIAHLENQVFIWSVQVNLISLPQQEQDYIFGTEKMFFVARNINSSWKVSKEEWMTLFLGSFSKSSQYLEWQPWFKYSRTSYFCLGLFVLIVIIEIRIGSSRQLGTCLTYWFSCFGGPGNLYSIHHNKLTYPNKCTCTYFGYESPSSELSGVTLNFENWPVNSDNIVI